MTAERAPAPGRRSTRGWAAGGRGARGARVFDGAIALAGLVALALWIAGALAPRFGAAMPAAALSSDGGHAYTFSPRFAAPWPYAVPSHPASALGPRDVRVTEDGRAIGALDPAHADIRERGGGLYNLWEGTIWFSPSDGTDPRTNGRDYALSVRGRLDPAMSLVRAWATGLFAVLLAFRIAAVVASRAAAPLASAARGGAAPLGRAFALVPLDLRRSFWLVCAVGLGIFAWQTLVRPMPLLFEIDSFTYVQPGVLWDAGRSVAGQSSRDVGYPALAALALSLGSLARLPLLQLAIVVVGLALVLWALCRAFELIAARLATAAKLPVAVTATFACLAAAAYLAALFSHDLFVIDIYSAMAEAPHLLPTAAAFALFFASWTSRDPVRSLCCAVAAAAAAYLSIMVKPHTSLVLALCAASAALVAIRHRAALRSPKTLATCAAAAAVFGAVHWADAVVTPRDADFGPKTIFCNHLDVVAPAFDASTAERARVAALVGDVLRAPGDWTLLGFDGDRCVYNMDMTRAIGAAAAAEGISPASWQGREFLRAVAARPGAYARDVLKQLAYYMLHPIADIDNSAESVMPEDVWERFAPFMDRIRMTRGQFVGEVRSWVPNAYPRLSRWVKLGLEAVGATFAAVTLGGAALALAALATIRGRADLRLEAGLVATGAFTMAFATTTALSHTFDISRYLTDMLPFSLIWWLFSAAYLAQALALCAAAAVRGGAVATVSRSQGDRGIGRTIGEDPGKGRTG